MLFNRNVAVAALVTSITLASAARPVGHLGARAVQYGLESSTSTLTLPASIPLPSSSVTASNNETSSVVVVYASPYSTETLNYTSAVPTNDATSTSSNYTVPPQSPTSSFSSIYSVPAQDLTSSTNSNPSPSATVNSSSIILTYSVPAIDLTSTLSSSSVLGGDYSSTTASSSATANGTSTLSSSNQTTDVPAYTTSIAPSSTSLGTGYTTSSPVLVTVYPVSGDNQTSLLASNYAFNSTVTGLPTTTSGSSSSSLVSAGYYSSTGTASLSSTSTENATGNSTLPATVVYSVVLPTFSVSGGPNINSQSYATSVPGTGTVSGVFTASSIAPYISLITSSVVSNGTTSVATLTVTQSIPCSNPSACYATPAPGTGPVSGFVTASTIAPYVSLITTSVVSNGTTSVATLTVTQSIPCSNSSACYATLAPGTGTVSDVVTALAPYVSLITSSVVIDGTTSAVTLAVAQSVPCSNPAVCSNSSVVPVYTPGNLGNAYGGGYISTPSVYAVVPSASPSRFLNGVPPGYGYSFGPESFITVGQSSGSYQAAASTSTALAAGCSVGGPPGSGCPVQSGSPSGPGQPSQTVIISTAIVSPYGPLVSLPPGYEYSFITGQPTTTLSGSAVSSTSPVPTSQSGNSTAYGTLFVGGQSPYVSVDSSIPASTSGPSVMVPSGYGYSLLPGNPPTILISHSGSDSAYGTPTTIALPPDSTTSGQSQYLSMIVTLPAPPGFVPTGLRPLYTMVLPLPTSALSYSQAGGSTASTYIAGSTGGPISVNASSSAGYYVTPEGSTVLLQSSYLSGSPTLGASTETTGPMGSTSTGGSSYTAGSSGESTPSISPGGAIYTGASGNVSVPINPSALATFEGSANKHSAVGTITLVLTGLACICVL